MKLFRLYGSQDFWTVYYKGERGIGNKGIKDKYYLAEYKGIQIANEWKKVEVKITFRGEQGVQNPDIMDFGGLLGIAMTSHAKDILKDFILPYCELLPVDLDGSEIYIVNPIVILDCLDYKKSVIEPIPPLYKDQKIVKYVFRSDLDYPPIFRITDTSLYGIFVNERLVEKLNESGVIGYNTKELWDSNESNDC